MRVSIKEVGFMPKAKAPIPNSIMVAPRGYGDLICYDTDNDEPIVNNPPISVKPSLKFSKEQERKDKTFLHDAKPLLSLGDYGKALEAEEHGIPDVEYTFTTHVHFENNENEEHKDNENKSLKNCDENQNDEGGEDDFEWQPSSLFPDNSPATPGGFNDPNLSKFSEASSFLFNFPPSLEQEAMDSLKSLVDQLYLSWKSKQTNPKHLAKMIMRDLLRPITTSFSDKDLKAEIQDHVNSILSLLRLHYLSNGLNNVLLRKPAQVPNRPVSNLTKERRDRDPAPDEIDDGNAHDNNPSGNSRNAGNGGGNDPSSLSSSESDNSSESDDSSNSKDSITSDPPANGGDDSSRPDPPNAGPRSGSTTRRAKKKKKDSFTQLSKSLLRQAKIIEHCPEKYKTHEERFQEMAKTTGRAKNMVRKYPQDAKQAILALQH